MEVNSTNSQNFSTDVEHTLNLEKISACTKHFVYEQLGAKEKGLTSDEVQARLERYGKNLIEKKPTFHPLRSFAKNFVNVFAILLWIGSVLALISGTTILSIVIWCIIVINAVFSFFQESKADKAMQALAQMMPSNVKVFRNGAIVVLPASELVPGDLVILAAGDKVPADIRLVEADSLLVDNSMLTGESLPVERDAEPETRVDTTGMDYRNLVFGGTTITSGKAKGIVYATGERTQIGNITETTSHIVKGKSTLEVQINKITKILGIVAMCIGLSAFCISLFVTDFTVNAALIFTIGIIVANIPEGLMPTVSLSLAMSVQRMAKKNALVRKQSAVETLSSTTVICTDKTGTLTQNSMFAKTIWTADGSVKIDGEGYEKAGRITGITERNQATLEKLLTASIICSDTILQTNKMNDTCWEFIGNPTEAAILIAAEKFGLQIEKVRENFEQTYSIPFSSNKKTMTVWAKSKVSYTYSQNESYCFTKGAPVKVAGLSKYIFKNGRVAEMTAEEREEVLNVNNQMASEGFRVLAIAFSPSDGEFMIESDTENLIFLGMVAMYDPPKEGVQEAVADCYRAGIKVTVVTGDYSVTAVAIAKQIGIIQGDYVVVTGPELEKMSSEELCQKIDTDKPVIFARTTPDHKLKIVEAYQSQGHVVASTGDGINDVLALNKADIGISMGNKGSDAAIESSEVVLLDDNFATIVEAVKEGRAIYYNIQKFITYILASNVPEVIPFIVMGLFNIPLALTVLLVLAIDLGTDLIPAISLGEELPDKDVLDSPPRSTKSNILNGKVMLRAYAFLGVIETAMLFVMFFFAWDYFGYSFNEVRTLTSSITDGTASEQVMYAYKYAVTLAFGAVIACQIGNVLVCRSTRSPLYKSMKKKNHLMIWGILLEAVLFLFIAYVPLLQKIFGTVGPEFNHLILLLGCPIVLISIEEVRKWLVRARSTRMTTV